MSKQITAYNSISYYQRLLALCLSDRMELLGSYLDGFSYQIFENCSNPSEVMDVSLFVSLMCSQVEVFGMVRWLV